MAEVVDTAPLTTGVRDELRLSPATAGIEEELADHWFEREFGFRPDELERLSWEADHFTLSSSMANCQEARVRVDRVAEAAGMCQVARSDIMLAVGEAVANAVEHGNCGNPDGSFRVCCLATAEKLWVSVSDEGLGFRPDDLPSIEEALLTERGRGVHCMNAVMDEVGFDFASGTTVRMMKMG